MIQVFQDHLFCNLHCVDEPLLLRELWPVHEGLYAQVQQNECNVDQRSRGAVKIVIVHGDELAKLIDERPEAKASQDCSNVICCLVYVSESDDQGDHHENSTQENMGNVQVSWADTRIAGQSQKEADAQDRSHCSNEENLQQALAFQATDEMSTKTTSSGLCLFNRIVIFALLLLHPVQPGLRLIYPWPVGILIAPKCNADALEEAFMPSRISRRAWAMPQLPGMPSKTINLSDNRSMR